MGHKVNPKVFRLGNHLTWHSRWFASKNYAEYLKQDVMIRRYLKNKLKEAGIDKLDIERTPTEITIIIVAARPGIIIGRGGSGIEDIKTDLMKRFLPNSRQNIKISIKEVDNPNLSAANVAYQISQEIEKRMPFRRVMKQSIDRVMKANAKGVKVILSGRLNGVDIARTETLSEGKVPLHTIRADIDYSRCVAMTTYGTIGVKVWIYKGEVFEKEVVTEVPVNKFNQTRKAKTPFKSR